jgi:glycogen debranching enzyme
MNVIEKAYQKAIEVLNKCATKNGFYAAYPGYDAVWARDSMIISLGASIIKNNSYKSAFKQSLLTLSKKQSKTGQIPNAVDIFSRRKPHTDFGSIDSTLWFIIGNYTFNKRYKENKVSKNKKQIKEGLKWLAYQDTGEKGMLVQLPTTDWQDCFPHRYGYTINTQALYYKVLTLTGNKKEAKHLKSIVHNKKEGLWNHEYYMSYRWKDHNKFLEQGLWFDTLGNLLAILFDLANKKNALKILSYIKKKKINYPFPVMTMYPPIFKNSKHWQDYFNDSDARNPYSYLNGGVWTYIGGFYILALVKYNKFKEAEQQLKMLAKGNLTKESNFAEWLHGKTGEPNGGNNQGWNAALYVLAYESVKRKKVVL